MENPNNKGWIVKSNLDKYETSIIIHNNNTGKKTVRNENKFVQSNLKDQRQEVRIARAKSQSSLSPRTMMPQFYENHLQQGSAKK